jgi:molybdate transport system regulatory protein
VKVEFIVHYMAMRTDIEIIPLPCSLPLSNVNGSSAVCRRKEFRMAGRSVKGEGATAGPRLSIRLDLANGDRIGPGKIALLEAIRDTGSISAGARKVGMSYRRAWLLVEDINGALQEPAVLSLTGGRRGGGASVTPFGDRIIRIYRSIETAARRSASGEFRAVDKIVHKGRRNSA